jgi:hypothetical protein
MAKLSKSDLEALSSDEIKHFYTCENVENLNIPIVKQYLLNGDGRSLPLKINRVESLLNQVIVERFVKGTL